MKVVSRANRIRAISFLKRILNPIVLPWPIKNDLNAILPWVILLLSLLIAIWTLAIAGASHELLAHWSDVPAYCWDGPEEWDLPPIRISMNIVVMELVSLIPLALSARLFMRTLRLSLLNTPRLREYALTFVLVVVCGFLILSLSGGILGRMMQSAFCGI
jgi:hypothetical protein